MLKNFFCNELIFLSFVFKHNGKNKLISCFLSLYSTFRLYVKISYPVVRKNLIFFELIQASFSQRSLIILSYIVYYNNCFDYFPAMTKQWSHPVA